MILAFHGEASLKSAVMDRLREHRRMDTIVQKVYYDDGRGCQLGCLTHVATDTHATAERLFGIDQRIGFWLEAVFEGLPKGECAQWVIESTEAIPVGADLSKCHHHFAAWLLGESGLLAIVDCNREAIDHARRLHVAAANGEAVNESAWAAARSAAESAAESARSAARSAAESAARSAAWSAWSAAEAAARSAAWSAWAAARSAAESARSAAEAAAWAAAWTKIAAKSIEIFSQAPVVSQSTMDCETESELRCRNLWCRDGGVVVV